MRAVEPDAAHRWAQVVNGDAPMTWQLWAQDISQSQTLTPAGRTTLLGAVDIISAFLGQDWLEIHRRDGASSSPEMPLMSMRWWPSNDVAHVYMRVLEFALRLKLLQAAAIPGLGAVRKDTAGDLGHFMHSYVQLEVAALALADQWEVKLEPQPAQAAGRRVDLLLSKGTDVMAVEVKTFQVDDVMRADLAVGRVVHERLLSISATYGVQFDGHIEAPTSSGERDALLAWIDELAGAAAHARHTSAAARAVPPTGGALAVVPDEQADECSWSMSVRSRDPLYRLLGQIKNKAEQGRGGGALWLRINETQEFFHQLIPARAVNGWPTATGSYEFSSATWRSTRMWQVWFSPLSRSTTAATPSAR